jgi:hypothetical protein
MLCVSRCRHALIRRERGLLTGRFRTMSRCYSVIMVMSPKQTELQDRRGLRFAFAAAAEVVPVNQPGTIAARVTELSLRGCFLELSANLKEHQRLHVKISHDNERFESLAQVMYVRPEGVGVVFGETQSHFRKVLQGWILSAMDQQSKTKQL